MIPSIFFAAYRTNLNTVIAYFFPTDTARSRNVLPAKSPLAGTTIDGMRIAQPDTTDRTLSPVGTTEAAPAFFTHANILGLYLEYAELEMMWTICNGIFEHFSGTRQHLP